MVEVRPEIVLGDINEIPVKKRAVEVTDADAVVDRAVALGATLLRPVADQFYGRRAGTIRDPWGHQWSIGSPLPGFNDAQYAANAEGIGLRLERPET